MHVFYLLLKINHFDPRYDIDSRYIAFPETYTIFGKFCRQLWSQK